jgi:lipopolysaccharide export system protein LptA
MKKIVTLGLLAALAFTASAERADSLKKIVVNYDTIESDQVTQTSVLSGDVVLTRGTLVLKADKAVLKETPDGYMMVTLTAGQGKSSTFRQKKDGAPDLWVEGQAQKIEYDERGEVVKMFGKAKVRELDGAKVTQELDQEYISYDSRKEKLLGRNDASGADVPGKGRGTMVIEPKRTAPPAPAPAAGKQ